MASSRREQPQRLAGGGRSVGNGQKELYMKVLSWSWNNCTLKCRPMADQIDASAPLPLAYALVVSLAPALHDAQEALQKVEKKRRKEDLAVEEGVKEVLTWAQVHRPKNIGKNYLPKQMEWKAWCETMAFRPGGESLPFDWVDEDRLLLFIKMQVAAHAPRKGSRLVAKRKRRLGDELEGSIKQRKRRKQEAGIGTIAEEALEISGAPDRGDDKLQSELCLMYNSVKATSLLLWSSGTTRYPRSYIHHYHYIM